MSNDDEECCPMIGYNIFRRHPTEADKDEFSEWVDKVQSESVEELNDRYLQYMGGARQDKGKAKPVSLSDAVLGTSTASNGIQSNGNDNRLYAMTLNIQPCCYNMNRKRWDTYTHDKQRAILMRVEASFRKNNLNVTLQKLNYELCPTLNNIHFHAMYKMNLDDIVAMKKYYKRICEAKFKTPSRVPWRYLDISIIEDTPDAWLRYIAKDEPKK